MAKITWDHIHLRTTNPEGMAQWFEKMLGAEIMRSTQGGQTRIDLKLGGGNIFIAPVKDGDGTNAAPAIPYRGLDHFGLSVSGIDAHCGRSESQGRRIHPRADDGAAGRARLLYSRARRRVDRVARPRPQIHECGVARRSDSAIRDICSAGNRARTAAG